MCWWDPFHTEKLMLGMFASCCMKISLVSSSRPQSPDQLFSRQASDASVSPRTSDSSAAPVADFDYPPEFSSCLDNSAAKHKLLVKPRNQRSSKMRRLSSVIGLLTDRLGGHPLPPTPTSLPSRAPSEKPPWSVGPSAGAEVAHLFQYTSDMSLSCINMPSVLWFSNTSLKAATCCASLAFPQH